MPVGALLAPILEAAIGPALGVAAGGLGEAALTAGIGAGLGAGSGAAFGALTGEGAGPGALSGAIGGAAVPLGGALGEAAGIGSTAGAAIGGAAGGAAGGAVTGQSPLIGAVEGGASGLASGALSDQSSAGDFSSGTKIASTPPAAGVGSAASIGGGAGAQTAALTGSIPTDPTAGSGIGATKVADLSFDPNAPGGFGGGPGSPTINVGPDPSTSGGGFQSFIDRLTSNPTQLLAAAPLAMALFNGNQPYPAASQLNQLGTNLQTQGQSLQGYLQSGTLPAGAQANVDAGVNAAKARVRSNYAALGLGGSTMEAQALAQIDQQKAGQQFLLASDLLKTGIGEEQYAAGAYNDVLRAQMAQDQQLQNAILNAARGLGGAGFGTNYAFSQPSNV